MKKHISKVVCITVLAASALALQAADVAKTFYVKADAGVSLLNDLEFDVPVGAVEIEADAGLRVDLAVGYNVTKDVAVELEAGFVWNKLSKVKVTPPWDFHGPGDLQADYYQVPLLANVVYHIPLDSKFKPFIGGGAGGVWSIVSNGSVEDDLTFAFQGQAGVDYELSDNMDIGVAYKFLGALEPDLGGDVSLKNVYTHSIVAVVTFRF